MGFHYSEQPVLTGKCRVLKKENLSFYIHHKAIIKMRSGKDHEQMLNIRESFDEHYIYMVLKGLSTEWPLVARDKIVPAHWRNQKMP